MSSAENRWARGTLAGVALVVVGVGLWMFVHKGFLFVAGLGAFGPGLLREMGLLRDQDEFQRGTSRRAGQMAYLVGGMLMVVVLSVARWRAPGALLDSEWLMLVLVVSWLVWLFVSLLTYWGAVTTARRVLLSFGAFWTVFVLAVFIGDFEWPRNGADVITGLTGLVAGIAILSPFYLGAWAAGRWPRATGWVLVSVAAVGVAVFARPGPLDWSTVATTQAILTLPLVTTGLALVQGGGNPELN